MSLRNKGAWHTLFPCFGISEVICLFPQQLRVQIDNSVMSARHHSTKVRSTTAGNSIVAVMTDLWHHLTYNSMGAWHTMYAMLPLNYK